jgi:putative SOS response-associated peptidase YedK
VQGDAQLVERVQGLADALGEPVSGHEPNFLHPLAQTKEVGHGRADAFAKRLSLLGGKGFLTCPIFGSAPRRKGASRFFSNTATLLHPRGHASIGSSVSYRSHRFVGGVKGVCARFTLYTPGNLIAERFLLAQIPSLVARYNIAPSQPLPVIDTKAGGLGRGLAMFRWGFIPRLAQDDKGMRPVNAKSETVASSVMFAESFRTRRCLVPADGFYEWRAEGKRKLPIHFRLKDRTLFAFAGIWDIWKGPAGPVFTCAILTTEPNELTKQVHDRMPVILPRDREAEWLDPGVSDTARLSAMLGPYPAVEMDAVPANPAMNKPAFEGPECLTLQS